jgi:uncharacterized protein YdeI (YjbR/CyaY-like superfamily)
MTAGRALHLLEVRTLSAWRAWLAAHHATASDIWLVFRKKHTGQSTIAYGDALDEALCWGWIDSLVRRIDEDRYARKFTPRQVNSRWSTINRARYARLKRAGRLEPAGVARPPTARSGDAPARRVVGLPADVARALRTRGVWPAFERLAPSHRRHYVGWIDSAKNPETRARRLAEVVDRLASGQPLGLK